MTIVAPALIPFTKSVKMVNQAKELVKHDFALEV